jgi:hypothetical protein
VGYWREVHRPTPTRTSGGDTTATVCVRRPDGAASYTDRVAFRWRDLPLCGGRIDDTSGLPRAAGEDLRYRHCRVAMMACRANRWHELHGGRGMSGLTTDRAARRGRRIAAAGEGAHRRRRRPIRARCGAIRDGGLGAVASRSSRKDDAAVMGTCPYADVIYTRFSIGCITPDASAPRFSCACSARGAHALSSVRKEGVTREAVTSEDPLGNRRSRVRTCDRRWARGSCRCQHAVIGHDQGCGR